MLGLGLQRPGDDIGVEVDGRVRGSMPVSNKDQVKNVTVHNKKGGNFSGLM